MAKYLLIALGFVALFETTLLPRTVRAAPPYTCEGVEWTYLPYPPFAWPITHEGTCIWRGGDNSVDIYFDKCSLGYNGDEEYDSAWYAAHAWGDLISETGDYWDKNVNDCTVTLGNGRNEASIAPQGTIDTLVGLPDHHGVVVNIFDDDYHGEPYEPWIVEADAYVSETLDFSDPSATFSAWEDYSDDSLGRQAFFHEFGHFFGFKHEFTNYFTVMEGAQFGGYPTVAGTPSNVLWPNDVNGLNQQYGLKSSLPNLIPSAHKLNDAPIPQPDNNPDIPPYTIPLPIQTGTPDLCDACTGDYIPLEMYIGNTGKVSSGPFWVRVYLTTTPYASTTGGEEVAVHYFSGRPAFTEKNDYDLGFYVPEGIQGVHYINIYVDYVGSIAEVSNQDNWTISAMKLQANQYGFCPLLPGYTC